MTISFTGGQALPAYGTPAYNALVSAQNSGTSGAGNFNPSTGALTVNGQSIPTPAAGSTLADLATVPNTGKGTVSSSLSSQMGLNAQNAVTGTAVNQPQVDPNQASADIFVNFYKSQGYNMNSADILNFVKGGDSMQTASQRVFEMASLNKQSTDAEKQRQSELSSQANIHAQELAGSNATFAAARTKLEEQKRKDLEGAKAQAYANNPYAATSSTTSDYMGAVSREYAALDAQLTSQAEAAKAALEAGDGKTVAAINANMNSLLAQGQQNIANNLRDLQKTNIQQQQFSIGQKNVAQDNLMNMVNTFSATPSLQTDVGSYLENGKITPALEPFFNQGRSAGLSDTETASILKYGTSSALFKQKQLDMAQTKMDIAADKMTRAQNLTSTIQAVNLASQQLISRGVPIGSIEFAVGLAQATAGSQTGLSTAEVGAYQSYANISGILLEVEDNLKSIEKDSDFKNIILGYAGQTVQSLTDKDLAVLTAKLTSIAAPLARLLYGEKGTLTEGDVSRVFSSLPVGTKAADIRNELYKSLLTNISVSAANKLALDSTSGRNVSAIAPYIQEFSKKINSTVKSSQTPQKGDKQMNNGGNYEFDGTQWKLIK